MNNTNSGLIAYAKAQVGKPYWFGTFGQIASATLLKNKKKQYPNYYTATDFNKQYGQRVHDCSGLIKGYLMRTGDDTDDAPKYDKKLDYSAAGFYARAEKKGAIFSFDHVPGRLVFKGKAENAIHHIGVYVGDGKVIEAIGHSYGVKETDFEAGGWSFWAQCHAIEEDAKTTAPEPVTETPSESDTYYTVKKGDTLTAIAKKFGTTIKELQTLNKISNPNHIVVGEKILLPKGKVAPVASAPVKSEPETFIGTVNTVSQPLNVRKGAGMDYDRIKTLPKGSKVELYKNPVNGWYRLANGSGYVSAKYIK